MGVTFRHFHMQACQSWKCSKCIIGEAYQLNPRSSISCTLCKQPFSWHACGACELSSRGACQCRGHMSWSPLGCLGTTLGYSWAMLKESWHVLAQFCGWFLGSKLHMWHQAYFFSFLSFFFFFLFPVLNFISKPNSN